MGSTIGSHAFTIGPNLAEGVSLLYPRDIALSPDDSTLYIVDSGKKAAFVTTWEGAYIKTLTIPGLVSPTAVEVLPDGRIAVLDEGAFSFAIPGNYKRITRLYMLAPDGESVLSIWEYPAQGQCLLWIEERKQFLMGGKFGYPPNYTAGEVDNFILVDITGAVVQRYMRTSSSIAGCDTLAAGLNGDIYAFRSNDGVNGIPPYGGMMIRLRLNDDALNAFDYALASFFASPYDFGYNNPSSPAGYSFYRSSAGANGGFAIADDGTFLVSDGWPTDYRDGSSMVFSLKLKEYTVGYGTAWRYIVEFEPINSRLSYVAPGVPDVPYSVRTPGHIRLTGKGLFYLVSQNDSKLYHPYEQTDVAFSRIQVFHTSLRKPGSKPPGTAPGDCDDVEGCTPWYAGRRLQQLSTVRDQAGFWHTAEERKLGIYYLRRHDGKIDWTEAIRLDDGTTDAIKPGVSIGGDGTVYVDWEEPKHDGRVRRAQSTQYGEPGSWQVVQ
jgi:hypothetical protein